MIRRTQDTGWRRRFAILPITLSNGPEKTSIWFEWVWVRDSGDVREVSVAEPAEVAALRVEDEQQRWRRVMLEGDRRRPMRGDRYYETPRRRGRL